MSWYYFLLKQRGCWCIPHHFGTKTAPYCFGNCFGIIAFPKFPRPSFRASGQSTSLLRKVIQHLPWTPGAKAGFWNNKKLGCLVLKIFYVHPYLGKWSNLTNMFQRGWNHQLEKLGLLVGFFGGSLITRWWFQIFFMFTPTWGNDPIWLIFFKGVETTN